jgi:hypothetical protein
MATHWIECGDPENAGLLLWYAAGIEHFGVISNSDPLYTLETAIGYDRTSKNNYWRRKHAFSALRELKPTKVVYVTWLPFVSHQKTMQELILDTIRREVNWDIRLAAAEVLTAWAPKKSNECLRSERSGIYRLSTTIEPGF